MWDKFIDLFKIGGPLSVAGAVLGVSVATMFAPPSNKPANCGVSMPVSTTLGLWQCLTPDGTWQTYKDPTLDESVGGPAGIGGIVGLLVAVALKKDGWGDS